VQTPSIITPKMHMTTGHTHLDMILAVHDRNNITQ